MKKLSNAAAIFAAFAVLAVSAAAQSGRRVTPAATPTPAPEAADFSDSKPLPRRPTLPQRIPQDGPNSASGSAPPANDSTQPAAPAADGEVFKVDTNLVTVPVSVYDRNGLYIPNLQQSDFKIFDNGKEQSISYFGSSEKPFTVVLLLDTSLSTVYRIEDIQAAANAFINLLKPQDQVMVIEFDGNANVLSEPTNDRAKLAKAIKKADFGYGTSLYEAVDFVIRKRLNTFTGRKAIVLFTDGVDTTSHKATYDSTLAVAEESDSLIFPVYYDTSRDNYARTASTDATVLPSTASEYAVGRRYLDEISAYTGGRVFVPESTPGGLVAAFEGIAEELRRQYNIGFVPSDEGTPGERRTIRVRVNRPNLVVRARDSYIVGVGSKGAKKN